MISSRNALPDHQNKVWPLTSALHGLVKLTHKVNCHGKKICFRKVSFGSYLLHSIFPALLADTGLSLAGFLLLLLAPPELSVDGTPPPLFFCFSNWRMIALQCCVGFCLQQRESALCAHPSPLPWASLQHSSLIPLSRSSQRAGLGSLCYMAASQQLPILHIGSVYMSLMYIYGI